MELDKYQKLWHEHDEKLDKYIKFNARQLEKIKINNARSALDDFLRIPLLGLFIGVVLQVCLAFFLISHIAMPQFVVAALVINIFVIFQIIVSAYQVHTIRRIYLDSPVTTVQKKLGKLIFNRNRYLTVTRFSYPLLWVPVLLVMSKALINVNLFLYLEQWWIWMNIIIGILCLGIGICLSKPVFREKISSRLLTKLIDNITRNDITGKSLNQAVLFLNSIQTFEDEN